MTGNISYSHLEKQSPHTVSDTCVLWFVFSVAKSFQGVSAHFSLCQGLDLLISVCGHALGVAFPLTMEAFYATTHIFSSGPHFTWTSIFDLVAYSYSTAIVQNGGHFISIWVRFDSYFDFLN